MSYKKGTPKKLAQNQVQNQIQDQTLSIQTYVEGFLEEFKSKGYLDYFKSQTKVTKDNIFKLDKLYKLLTNLENELQETLQQFTLTKNKKVEKALHTKILTLKKLQSDVRVLVREINVDRLKVFKNSKISQDILQELIEIQDREVHLEKQEILDRDRGRKQEGLDESNDDVKTEEILYDKHKYTEQELILQVVQKYIQQRKNIKLEKIREKMEIQRERERKKIDDTFLKNPLLDQYHTSSLTDLEEKKLSKIQDLLFLNYTQTDQLILTNMNNVSNNFQELLNRFNTMREYLPTVSNNLQDLFETNLQDLLDSFNNIKEYLTQFANNFQDLFHELNNMREDFSTSILTKNDAIQQKLTYNQKRLQNSIHDINRKISKRARYNYTYEVKDTPYKKLRIIRYKRYTVTTVRCNRFKKGQRVILRNLRIRYFLKKSQRYKRIRGWL
jgi:hypothetical protein